MSETNLLEYLFASHSGQLRRDSDLLVLFIHACLLDRKAKLESGSAVLPSNWNDNDPIQLTYQLAENTFQVSLTETAGDVFLCIADDRNDRVGSLELSSGELCKKADTFEQAYFDLTELRSQFDKNMWSIIFPPPATSSLKEGTCREEEKRKFEDPPIVPPSLGRVGRGRDTFAFDYGRSDLDPFGLGRNPLGGPGMGIGGPGMGGIGGGGMMFDPLRADPRLRHDPDRFGGFPEPLPPGAVPPGARFDPFGPPRGGQQGRRPRGPDPDGMPGGGEWNMYL